MCIQTLCLVLMHLCAIGIVQELLCASVPLMLNGVDSPLTVLFEDKWEQCK